MSFGKFFSRGRKEQQVTERMADHIDLLCEACAIFHQCLVSEDRRLARKVPDMEREADVIRREIVSTIYAGAFLPYLRPDLCRFVSLVDEVFDLLQETANIFVYRTVPESLKGECIRVALLNLRMCELLRITYGAMLEGADLKEKKLGLRIYEKKIDDIKYGLLRDMMEIEVDNFWQGRLLGEFIDNLTGISDKIEDASDHLDVLNVSMR
ncbi:MAG TPA: TIGR00153 family protein [Desulfobacteraceae bacterium]|nr:TIGR00153 family protein [Deltaproteobacteria bacterium]MBW2355452.1 TIGR00153 family protein [Deltaproteobacteria bacterium]HDI59022.1 TIGR00153 family protein [Desulfobacteraceae bacterium]